MTARTARSVPVLRRPALGAAAAALAVAALTGCGSSEPDADAGAGAAATTSESAEATTESSAPAEDSESESSEAQAIEVSAIDFDFEMIEDAYAPGTYEITLTNDGGASHDLVVERDGEDVAASEVIPPGETSTFEVTLEEGEYVFYCSVGNHRSIGMEVPVEVTA